MGFISGFPDSTVHGTNMGPTWVLSAPDGPHVGPMNLDIRLSTRLQCLPLSHHYFLLCFLHPVLQTHLSEVKASQKASKPRTADLSKPLYTQPSTVSQLAPGTLNPRHNLKKCRSIFQNNIINMFIKT